MEPLYDFPANFISKIATADTVTAGQFAPLAPLKSGNFFVNVRFVEANDWVFAKKRVCGQSVFDGTFFQNCSLFLGPTSGFISMVKAQKFGARFGQPGDNAT